MKTESKMVIISGKKNQGIEIDMWVVGKVLAFLGDRRV